MTNGVRRGGGLLERLGDPRAQNVLFNLGASLLQPRQIINPITGATFQQPNLLGGIAQTGAALTSPQARAAEFQVRTAQEAAASKQRLAETLQRPGATREEIAAARGAAFPGAEAERRLAAPEQPEFFGVQGAIVNRNTGEVVGQVPETKTPFIKNIEALGIDPGSPQALRLFNQQFGPRSEVNVTVGQTARSGQIVKRAGVTYEKADQARNTLDSVEQMQSILDEGLVTGARAPSALKFQKALSFFGLEDADRLSQAEAFDAFANQLGKNNFAGMAPLSDGDRDFALTFGPQLKKTNAANEYLLELARRRSQGAIEIERALNEYSAGNNGVIDDGWLIIQSQMEEDFRERGHFTPEERQQFLRRAETEAATLPAEPEAGAAQNLNTLEDFRALGRSALPRVNTDELDDDQLKLWNQAMDELGL